jgi:hypothetical protein
MQIKMHTLSYLTVVRRRKGYYRIVVENEQGISRPSEC